MMITHMQFLSAMFMPMGSCTSHKEIDSSIKSMAIIEMTIDHMTAKEAIELVKMKKVDTE